MKAPQPLDNYTDSDDDDAVVIGHPAPPTPPKASKKNPHLTIDVILEEQEEKEKEDEDEDEDDDSKHIDCFTVFCCTCAAVVMMMSELCLSLTRLLRLCC